MRHSLGDVDGLSMHALAHTWAKDQPYVEPQQVAIPNVISRNIFLYYPLIYDGVDGLGHTVIGTFLFHPFAPGWCLKYGTF